MIWRARGHVKGSPWWFLKDWSEGREDMDFFPETHSLNEPVSTWEYPASMFSISSVMKLNWFWSMRRISLSSENQWDDSKAVLSDLLDWGKLIRTLLTGEVQNGNWIPGSFLNALLKVWPWERLLAPAVKFELHSLILYGDCAEWVLYHLDAANCWIVCIWSATQK